eukprot:7741218-Lingulodinium_polyedra.AAC.1
MAIEYQADGKPVLRAPDGQTVEMSRRQGLSFVNWEDFVRIRAKLAESHRQGRPQYLTGQVAAAVVGPRG